MATRFIQGEKLQYSHAFKQKVVGEIESGKLTKNVAKELYGIKGGSTINCWIRKMGKNHLINKVVRIELKDEPSKLKELKQRTRELEKALADAHLKLLAYETFIEVAEEELGRSLKKKARIKSIRITNEKGKAKGEKAKIAKICEIFSISRQGYYKGLKRTTKETLNKEMIVQLVQSKRRRQPRVGGCKLYRMLKPDFQNMGIKMGRDRFFDIMRAEGLLINRRRGYHRTTNSNHRFRVYENLIEAIIASRADEIWVSDITYLRVSETFIYLSLITDLYSRKIIGYDISESLNIEGSIRSLKQAMRGKDKLEGTIHHSDRGIQYCSIGYTELLTSKGIKISMAAKGNPYENAVAERVNGILKEEFLLSGTFKSNTEAIKSTSEAIEIYNKERIHMSIDYKTPEEKYQESRVA